VLANPQRTPSCALVPSQARLAPPGAAPPSQPRPPPPVQPRPRTQTWDSKSSEAAQRALDEQLEEVLSALLDALTSELGGSVVGSDPSPGGGAAAPVGDRAAAAAAAARGSVLPPFLWHHLCSAAFTEMTARCPFYTTLLRIVQELCRPATARVLLSPAGGDPEYGSVAAAVRGMASAARHYGVAIRKTVLPAGAEASGSGAGVGGGRAGTALTVTARATAAGEGAALVSRGGRGVPCHPAASFSRAPAG
jgi:hypothetical protein